MKVSLRTHSQQQQATVNLRDSQLLHRFLLRKKVQYQTNVDTKITTESLILAQDERWRSA